MRYAILLSISALSLIGQSTTADIQTDEPKLKARTQAAKDLKEAAEKELREVARDWALRGSLLAMQFQFAQEAPAATISSSAIAWAAPSMMKVPTATIGSDIIKLVDEKGNLLATFNKNTRADAVTEALLTILVNVAAQRQFKDWRDYLPELAAQEVKK